MATVGLPTYNARAISPNSLRVSNFTSSPPVTATGKIKLVTLEEKKITCQFLHILCICTDFWSLIILYLHTNNRIENAICPAVPGKSSTSFVLGCGCGVADSKTSN